MELPPIGAGGVQAEQVAPLARRFAMDAVCGAIRRDRNIAAEDLGRLRLRQSGARDLRHRQGVAGGEPAADLQHAAGQVAVLHEGQLGAEDAEFRHPHPQREEAVVVPRRQRLQGFRPDRGRRGQGEGGGGRRLAEGEFHRHAVAFQREAEAGLAAPAPQHRVLGRCRLPGRLEPARHRPALPCALPDHFPLQPNWAGC
ncbi:hypothetical protein [Siccirubricoccus sp. G192]|uniref:hypothetical protein n=1 Tax=Siccirubricoccus sp. G192 TaxID=2849651 RepID=UPI001C2BCE68|nr:hypothetical protein [Siccirubricoccus sp. G192]MBV1797049.1 hypothetical protein [Siccirubricoccus sp. G192]